MPICTGWRTVALAYYTAQGGGRMDADSLARRARALHLIGDMAEKRGDLSEAGRSFEQAATATAALLIQSPEDGQRIFDQAQSEYWIGYVAFLRADWAKARRGFLRYLTLAEKLTLLDPGNLDWRAEVAYAQQHLGALAIREARPAEAIKALAQARRIWDELVTFRPAEWRWAANNLGWLATVNESTGGFQAAIDAELAKIAALSKVPAAASDRKVHYLLANAQYAIARRRLALGELDSAQQAIGDALQRFATLMAVDPSNVEWQAGACVSRLLAIETFAALQRPEAAQAELALVDATVDRLHGVTVGRPTWEVYIRGWQLYWRSRLKPATNALIDDMDTYLKNVSRFESAGKTLDAETQRAVSWAGLALGDVLAGRGRTAEARERWQAASQRMTTLVTAGDPRTLKLQALIVLRMGAVAEARSLAERVQSSGYRRPNHADLRPRLALAEQAPPSN